MRAKPWPVALFVATALAVLAARAQAQAPPPRAPGATSPCRDLGSLVVIVRDARTRRPIPLVNVLDLDRRVGAMANPRGVAELRCLATGKVRLRLYLRGYVGREGAVMLAAGRTDTLRLALRRDPRKLPPEDSIRVEIGRGANMLFGR